MLLNVLLQIMDQSTSFAFFYFYSSFCSFSLAVDFFLCVAIQTCFENVADSNTIRKDFSFQYMGFLFICLLKNPPGYCVGNHQLNPVVHCICTLKYPLDLI